mgnify:CR=1 FL=1
MNPYETQSYELTDGEEIFQLKDMTIQQAKRENEIIKLGTDGNIWWQPITNNNKEEE